MDYTKICELMTNYIEGHLEKAKEAKEYYQEKENQAQYRESIIYINGMIDALEDLQLTLMDAADGEDYVHMGEWITPDEHWWIKNPSSQNWLWVLDTLWPGTPREAMDNQLDAIITGQNNTSVSLTLRLLQATIRRTIDEAHTQANHHSYEAQDNLRPQSNNPIEAATHLIQNNHAVGEITGLQKAVGYINHIIERIIEHEKEKRLVRDTATD